MNILKLELFPAIATLTTRKNLYCRQGIMSCVYRLVQSAVIANSFSWSAKESIVTVSLWSWEKQVTMTIEISRAVCFYAAGSSTEKQKHNRNTKSLLQARSFVLLICTLLLAIICITLALQSPFETLMMLKTHFRHSATFSINCVHL